MTPNESKDGSRSGASTAGYRDMPQQPSESPRMSDVMERVRQRRAQANAALDGPVLGSLQMHTGGELHMSPAVPPPTHRRIALRPPAASPYSTLESRSVDILPTNIDTDANEHDPEELVETLDLRDVAREALRARLIRFGEHRNHRSSDELVFLMLAFSVTVILTAPPLIEVLLAAHGTRP